MESLRFVKKKLSKNLKINDMLRKEDYIGWQDQDLCTQYWKEAKEAREKGEWAELRKRSAPPKDSQLVVPGRMGSPTHVRVSNFEEYDRM